MDKEPGRFSELIETMKNCALQTAVPGIANRITSLSVRILSKKPTSW